jgi:hypothetical protein
MFYSLYQLSCVALPLVAIVTVTKSFARMTLTLIGALVALVVASALPLAFGVQNTGGQSTQHSIELAVALGISIAVILLQYAGRKVWIACGLLIAFPVFVFALSFANLDKLPIHLGGQAATTTSPVPVSFRADEQQAPKATGHSGESHRGDTWIQIPVQASNIPDGYGIMNRFDVIEFTAPDGYHWQEMHGQWQWKYFANHKDGNLFFEINDGTLSKYNGVPLTAKVTLDVTGMKAGKVTQVALPAPGEQVTIPDLGRCHWNPDIEHNYKGQLTCVSAMRPPLTSVTTHTAGTACAAREHELLAIYKEDRGSSWAGAFYDEPGWISFPPIESAPRIWDEDENNQARYLCTGTPITFTQYEKLGSGKVTFTLEGVRLPAPQ